MQMYIKRKSKSIFSTECKILLRQENSFGSNKMKQNLLYVEIKYYCWPKNFRINVSKKLSLFLPHKYLKRCFWLNIAKIFLKDKLFIQSIFLLLSQWYKYVTYYYCTSNRRYFYFKLSHGISLNIFKRIFYNFIKSSQHALENNFTNSIVLYLLNS